MSGRLLTRQIAAQLTSNRAADERAETSALKLLHKLLHNALPKQPKMHRNRCMPPYISQQHTQG
jgi:hypothetical protein